ncbi:hypothetical protein D3C76_1829480 [compost metagenome]
MVEPVGLMDLQAEGGSFAVRQGIEDRLEDVVPVGQRFSLLTAGLIPVFGTYHGFCRQCLIAAGM